MCCLAAWVKVASLPSILFPWHCGEFFWVYQKQISEQLRYTEFKTFGAGQGPKSLFQAPGLLATSLCLSGQKQETGGSLVTIQGAGPLSLLTYHVSWDSVPLLENSVSPFARGLMGTKML